jgi:GTP-binding nuclear protein Ran
LVLIGDGGVGKSAFVHRLMTGEYKAKYDATIGVSLHMIRRHTSSGGVIEFNIWDTAGSEAQGGLRDVYYLGADCAIFMFDVTSRITYDNIKKWHRDYTRVMGERKTPIVLLANKIDVDNDNRKVNAKQITFHRKNGLKLLEISVRSNYNVALPLLWLAQKLKEDRTLRFVDAPMLLQEAAATAAAIQGPSDNKNSVIAEYNEYSTDDTLRFVDAPMLPPEAAATAATIQAPSDNENSVIAKYNECFTNEQDNAGGGVKSE